LSPVPADRQPRDPGLARWLGAGCLQQGAAAPLEGKLPDMERGRLQEHAHVAELPQALDRAEVRLSAPPLGGLDTPAEGRPVRDHTDHIEQDALSGGITDLLEIARSLDTQGDAVARVVEVLQPGPLRERRDVVGGRCPGAGTVEEIAGEIADA